MLIVSRKEAVGFRLKHFFTGEACVNGHIAARYTIGGAGVECIAHNNKARNANYRLMAREARDQMQREKDANG